MPNRRKREFKVLVVEDDEARVEFFRACSKGLVRIIWAKTAGMAIGMINRDVGRVYDAIMLDHDLHTQNITPSDRQFNGMHVVDTIIGRVDQDVPIMVHSTNPARAPRMVEKLRGAGFAVDRLPFYDMKAQKLRDWLKCVAEASDKQWAADSENEA